MGSLLTWNIPLEERARQEVSGMAEEMGELEVKLALREERDRLLEIQRVLPDDAKEAKRLVELRLATIKETLES